MLLLVEGGFKWVEETSQFNEDFIKVFNENIGYFTGANVQHNEKLQTS